MEENLFKTPDSILADESKSENELASPGSRLLGRCNEFHNWIGIVALPIFFVGWGIVGLFPYRTLHYIFYALFAFGFVANIRCLVCDKNVFRRIRNSIWLIGYVAVIIMFLLSEEII